MQAVTEYFQTCQLNGLCQKDWQIAANMVYSREYEKVDFPIGICSFFKIIVKHYKELRINSHKFIIMW